jgi:hypothetical protein
LAPGGFSEARVTSFVPVLGASWTKPRGARGFLGFVLSSFDDQFSQVVERLAVGCDLSSSKYRETRFLGTKLKNAGKSGVSVVQAWTKG